MPRTYSLASVAEAGRTGSYHRRLGVAVNFLRTLKVNGLSGDSRHGLLMGSWPGAAVSKQYFCPAYLGDPCARRGVFQEPAPRVAAASPGTPGVGTALSAPPMAHPTPLKIPLRPCTLLVAVLRALVQLPGPPQVWVACGAAAGAAPVRSRGGDSRYDQGVDGIGIPILGGMIGFAALLFCLSEPRFKRFALASSSHPLRRVWCS